MTRPPASTTCVARPRLEAMTDWDIESVRYRFPALRRPGPDGEPAAWLDNAAGTQVVDTCLRAVNDYYLGSNANHGVPNAPSIETDELVAQVRQATADLLGVGDADEIAFGPNMTTLTFAVSRALGAALQPGDEIVVTRGDHDANVAPWLAVAAKRTTWTIRWVGLRADDCDPRSSTSSRRVMGPRTKLLAVGLVSNGTGTINPDASRIANVARSVGAHGCSSTRSRPFRISSIDVEALGADYLVCSPYKFYGPHLGVLWGRRHLLEALPPFHVRPAGRRHPRPLRDRYQAVRAAGRAGRHPALPGEGRHHPRRSPWPAGAGRCLPRFTAAGGVHRPPSAATRP